MNPGVKYSDEEFREAAKRLRSGPDMSVSAFAHVAPTRDGAFVEMTLWVPNAEAQAIRDERAYNAKGPA